jgi:hypothetical protein
MRYATIGIALLLGACGDGPATTAYNAYNACLTAKGVEGCQTERARFDAAVTYANAVSNRRAASPPPILAPQPVYTQREPVTCTTLGNTMTCR